MPRSHRVRQGESVVSLSKQYGIPPEKILDHPDNRELRDRERHRGVLFPGDHLTIPDRETKSVACATGERHVFRCRNQISWLKIRFLSEDEPRRNEAYVLTVDNREYRGRLDDDGWLRQRVPADAHEAEIALGEDGLERHLLRIGHLDPINELSGVQQRLENLGFAVGAVDDRPSEGLGQALREFQSRYGLEESAELDEATRNRLVEVHGS